jgi:hypothetical protein
VHENESERNWGFGKKEKEGVEWPPCGGHC